MQDLNLEKGKIAIIVAGLFCLYAVYGAIADFRLPDKAQAIEPSKPIVELDPVDINALVGAHLFGVPPAPPQVAAATRKDTKKNNTPAETKPEKPNTKPVQIKITVTGLLASADDDYAAAIMKVDNKPERMYKVGEDLGKAEVVLQSIGNESVVIDNNGNEQVFTLKRPSLESGGGGANQNQAANRQPIRNDSGIPPLPPELELQASGGYQDSSGAYSPELPEIEIPPPPLSEDMEEEFMNQEFARDVEGNYIDPENDMPPPLEEGEFPIESPNFQLPVF